MDIYNRKVNYVNAERFQMGMEDGTATVIEDGAEIQKPVIVLDGNPRLIDESYFIIVDSNGDKSIMKDYRFLAEYELTTDIEMVECENCGVYGEKDCNCLDSEESTIDISRD